jgi:hypothetical protein
MSDDPVGLFFNFAMFCVVCVYFPYMVLKSIWYAIKGKKRDDDK